MWISTHGPTPSTRKCSRAGDPTGKRTARITWLHEGSPGCLLSMKKPGSASTQASGKVRAGLGNDSSQKPRRPAARESQQLAFFTTASTDLKIVGQKNAVVVLQDLTQVATHVLITCTQTFAKTLTTKIPMVIKNDISAQRMSVESQRLGKKEKKLASSLRLESSVTLTQKNLTERLILLGLHII